jgi:hypothetical protein
VRIDGQWVCIFRCVTRPLALGRSPECVIWLAIWCRKAEMVISGNLGWCARPGSGLLRSASVS